MSWLCCSPAVSRRWLWRCRRPCWPSLFGLAYGLAAGLGPAWIDRLMMRLLDAVLALPSLIVLIFFAALVTLNDTSLILLLGLISWPGLARLVRNETLAQRGRDSCWPPSRWAPGGSILRACICCG